MVTIRESTERSNVVEKGLAEVEMKMNPPGKYAQWCGGVNISIVELKCVHKDTILFFTVVYFRNSLFYTLFRIICSFFP